MVGPLLLAFCLCTVPPPPLVVEVPRGYNPLASLRIADQPGWLTGLKLGRLAGDYPQCLAVLGEAAISLRPLPDRTTREGCALEGTVEVSRTSLRLSSRFTATCGLAAAWAMVEAHVLQQAALRHLGQPVAAMSHLGTFACRNVYGRDTGRRSQHASANAIDIAGFILADGSPVWVRDWRAADARRRAFLREVRDGACRFFATTLSPDYNAAHADHLHLDMGPFHVCR